MKEYAWAANSADPPRGSVVPQPPLLRGHFSRQYPVDQVSLEFRARALQLLLEGRVAVELGHHLLAFPNHRLGHVALGPLGGSPPRGLLHPLPLGAVGEIA